MSRYLICLAATLFTGAAIFTGLAMDVRAAAPSHMVFQAIRRGDSELLVSLLKQGTPPDLRAADGTTPLIYAALWGSAADVRSLLDQDATANHANQQGETALLLGAGDLQKVRDLLEAGADPNARSELGNTPLIAAAAYPESSEIVRLLIARGAEVNAKNRRGSTALSNAVTGGDGKTVKELLDHGARLSDNSTSVLSLAAERGYLEIVQLLLAHGANPDPAQGRHPLHSALLAQKPEIAKLLIESGAHLDKRLRPGNVPTIMLAAYTEVGDLSVAQELIERGVAMDVQNHYGENAALWASKRGNQELFEMLVSAGAAESRLPSPPTRPHRETTVSQESVVEAIRKSVLLLQQGSDGFLAKRSDCVSCHHQNLPAVAIGRARDLGFAVANESIERMVDAQRRSWKPRIHRAYQMDRPVPVEPRFLGYGLLGFAALGYPADEITDAMTWYLAHIQQPDGHWVPGMLRPPLGGSEIVSTVLAMRSLQLYSAASRASDTADRLHRAQRWLLAAEPRTHQQRVFKLLGLAWAGAASVERSDLAAELLAEQRADGGWAQLPGLESDAWATGQTLFALRTSAELSAEHEACAKGIEFLLEHQFEDGSWYVRHRSWPFQTHFESRFPHGRDQWVSAPATAWAVMALTCAITDETMRALHLASRTSEDKPAGPAARLDFSTSIQPIIRSSCIDCHSGDDPQGGLQLTSRRALLRGGASGEPAVVPGDPGSGLLLRYVSDEIEDLEMPPLGERDNYPALTKQQITDLKIWIEHGARWAEDVVLTKD